MSSKGKKLQKVLSGNGKNVSFNDFIAALHAAGFRDERQSASSHRIMKDGKGNIMNIQPMKDGDAKPYQVKQLQAIVRR